MGKVLGEIIIIVGIVIGLPVPIYLGLVEGKSFEDVQGIFLGGLAITILGGFIYRVSKNKHSG